MTPRRLLQWIQALVPSTMFIVFGVIFLAHPGRDDVSRVENRKLAPFPTFSAESLRRGQYTRDIELFISDHFPLRDPLVSLAFQVRARFGVAGHTRFYEAKDADDGGLEKIDGWAPETAPPVSGLEAAPAPAPDAGPGQKTAMLEPSKHPSTTRASVKNGVLIHDGRAMMLFTGNDESALGFASVVNTYRKKLADTVALHVVITPTATPFYIPDDARERTHSEKDNLETIRAAIDPSVHWADVWGALEPHADEEIFYLTDHHWTGRGAWYGYRAFCIAAGLAPVPLDKMEHRTRPPALGSLYRMTQDPALKKSADPIEYWLPSVPYTAVRYAGDDQKTIVHTTFIDESAARYLVFLGPDWPLMGARMESKSGRKALLVKNSFGNAFAPYLLPHFDEVVVMDYRYTVRTVSEIVKSHGITDVILLADTVTANSWPHRSRIQHVLTNAAAP